MAKRLKKKKKKSSAKKSAARKPQAARKAPAKKAALKRSARGTETVRRSPKSRQQNTESPAILLGLNHREKRLDPFTRKQKQKLRSEERRVGKEWRYRRW